MGKLLHPLFAKGKKGDSSVLAEYMYLYYLSGKTWSDRRGVPRGKQSASDETIKKVILCLHVYMGVGSSTWQLRVQHAVMACRIVSIANIDYLKGHCHDKAHVRSWLTTFFWLANRNLNTITSATNSPGVSRAFRKYLSAGFSVFVCEEYLLC